MAVLPGLREKEGTDVMRKLVIEETKEDDGFHSWRVQSGADERA